VGRDADDEDDCGEKQIAARHRWVLSH
jgi:hypothetical protein